MIGNRDAMGVAADVVEDLCGSGKGSFGVNAPFRFSCGLKVTRELQEIFQGLQGFGKPEFSGVEGLLERSQKQAAEQA